MGVGGALLLCWVVLAAEEVAWGQPLQCTQENAALCSPWPCAPCAHCPLRSVLQLPPTHPPTRRIDTDSVALPALPALQRVCARGDAQHHHQLLPHPAQPLCLPRALQREAGLGWAGLGHWLGTGGKQEDCLAEQGTLAWGWVRAVCACLGATAVGALRGGLHLRRGTASCPTLPPPSHCDVCLPAAP